MTKLEPVPTLAQIEYFYLMGQDENIKVLHDRKLQNPCMGEHSLITSWFPVPPTVVLSVPPLPISEHINTLLKVLQRVFISYSLGDIDDAGDSDYDSSS